MKTDNKNNHVLTYFQDESITNILKFILNEHQLILIKYDKDILPEQLNVKAVLLDNDINEIEKQEFLKFIDQHFPSAPILLTVGSHYKKTFISVYSQNIMGIIYKPFDVEEILSIMKEDLNLINE
jgi:DNA-binding NtrC family response regulator